jgi:hypothetical protein
MLLFSTLAWGQLTVRKQSTGTILMQVTDQGQVGIALGSSAPQATLDVGGTLRIGTVNAEGNSGDISVLVLDGGVVKKRTLTADIWDGDATGVGTETDPEWSANDEDHVIGNEYPLGGTAISVSSRTVNHGNTSNQGSINNSGRTVIQDVSLDGMGHVTNMNSTTINVNDADANPSNEIQTLSRNGLDLTISRGNTVDLPAPTTRYLDEPHNVLITYADNSITGVYYKYGPPSGIGKDSNGHGTVDNSWTSISYTTATWNDALGTKVTPSMMDLDDNTAKALIARTGGFTENGTAQDESVIYISHTNSAQYKTLGATGMNGAPEATGVLIMNNNQEFYLMSQYQDRTDRQMSVLWVTIFGYFK